MTPIIPYLIFPGTCREAMTFYQQCLGGDLSMAAFADMPGADQLPEAVRGGIAHASLVNGARTLMAYDDPHGSIVSGTAVSLSLACASVVEAERLFAALGQGGTVLMPLADQPWGAKFGMLTDRYGIQWMVDYDYPQE